MYVEVRPMNLHHVFIYVKFQQSIFVLKCFDDHLYTCTTLCNYFTYSLLVTIQFFLMNLLHTSFYFQYARLSTLMSIVAMSEIENKSYYKKKCIAQFEKLKLPHLQNLTFIYSLTPCISKKSLFKWLICSSLPVSESLHFAYKDSLIAATLLIILGVII